MRGNRVPLIDDLIAVLENESNTAVDWLNLKEMMVNPKHVPVINICKK